MMGPHMGPPPWEQRDKLKPRKPKGLRDIPRYLREVIFGFFYRLFYIFRLVWEAKPSLLIIMIFMVFFNGFVPIIGAYISANLLTNVAELLISGGGKTLEEAMSVILVPLLMQFGFLFAKSLVYTLSNIVTKISGEIVTNHVKLKIMNKSKDIDISRFDMPEFYEKMENANREAGARPIQILTSTFTMVSTVISVVGFIVILSSISWFAPLLVLVLSVPSAIISFIYRKKNFSYMRRRSKDRRQMTYYSDVIVNKDIVKEVRLFGLADSFINRYTEVFNKYFHGIKKLIRNEGIWSICISLATTILNCLLFIFIAYNVYRNGEPIGNYSLYTGALNSIASGVASFIALTSTIYEGSLFIENLITYMSENKSIRASIEPSAPLKRHCGHTIELRDVSFRYPGTTRDVIKNINLVIEPGDTIVMVGLNGAGKTTLIKLLTRLYDPTGGSILLDGRDIREYNVEELYRIYGIIFQDFGKYAVTVEENINFGQVDREIKESEITAAAKSGSAEEFIHALPDGYKTPLMRYFEDNGIELSIGQWQKLSIARAFYRDSDILILDEPTASLDAIAEQEIFRQFDELRHDKTTIFVSHRLSSATVASKILVLQKGELVETGNHSELMKKRGLYYELFSTQAKRYITTAKEDINLGNIEEDTYSEDVPDSKHGGIVPPTPPHDKSDNKIRH